MSSLSRGGVYGRKDVGERTGMYGHSGGREGLVAASLAGAEAENAHLYTPVKQDLRAGCKRSWGGGFVAPPST